MEIILNKNRKKTAKWRENCFDISSAKNLTAAVAPFFPDNLFLKKTTSLEESYARRKQLKKSLEIGGRENRENKGIGEKMKGQRFFSRSAYF